MNHVMNPPSITSLVMKITPAQALALLAKNYGNRPINRKHVTALANAMRRGEWKTTHQGIALSPDHRLLDGQHRLLAIAEARVTVQMLVAFDVPPDAFIALDRGRIRDVGMTLGVTQSQVATARLALGIMQGGNKSLDFSISQVRDAVEWLSPVWHATREAAPQTKKARSSAAVYLAIMARLIKAPANRPTILYWFKAFIELDYAIMPASVQSLCKQTTDSTASTRNNTDLIARAWAAFDVSKPDTKRLIVKDAAYRMEEVREVLMSDFAKWSERA